MNVPNAISLIRIALTPLFALLYIKGDRVGAMTVLAAAALSDMLDGHIARRMNMVTALGKALDPVADKLLQFAMLLCLVKIRAELWPLLALHLFRELSLGLLSLYTYRRTGTIIGAKLYGKICTASLYLVLALALVWPGMPEVFFWICAGMMLCCLAGYGGEFIRILQRAENEKKETPHSA